MLKSNVAADQLTLTVTSGRDLEQLAHDPIKQKKPKTKQKQTKKTHLIWESDVIPYKNQRSLKMLTYSVTFTSVENTQINLTAQILCKNNAED